MSSLPVLRQSAAELLALVVADLFPGARLVEGVATEQGFYCDIIATQPIDDYALPLLEEKMRAFTKQNMEVRTLEMMREVAANYLEHKGQPIRAEEARAASHNILSLIQIGNFCDYCPAPYISGTQEVESFKIFKVEKTVHYLPSQGWVDVKRIHGIVSTDKQSLKKMVKSLQAGKKADHTKLSEEIDLFSFHENISHLGFVWESNGEQLKDHLIHWWKEEHRQQGFSLVSTPTLIKESLLEKSGAYEDPSTVVPIIVEIDDISYVVAPSAKPAHLALFHQKTHSHREMPIRYAEFLPVSLRENTGLLGGLLDSRSISADEAHIFCAPEHLEEEFISSLQFIDKIIKMFGFEYYWYFKGRGHKYAGTENRWEKATNSLLSAFQKAGFTYASDPQEISFAGPLVEARLIDSFGREWKGPTVSLDLHAPERFGLRYLGSDGKTHVPLMIVRSVFGSLERFIALLLEHTSGILPLWLAPEQVRVLPVTKESDAYAKEVGKAVRDAGYRVNVDYGQDSIAKKITKADCEKVPYMIIVGDKEEKNHLVTLRNSYQTQEQMIPVEAFLSIIHEEVALKKLRVCKNTK